MEELQTYIAPARWEMIGEICQTERESFGDPWSENAFAACLDNPHMDFLVCLAGDEVVGYIITLNVPPETEIANIAVSPRFRRRQIGQLLLSQGIDRATERGSNIFYLEVRCSNAAAIGLYEKMGFVPIGIRKNYYKNPKEDALVMKYER